MNLRFLDLFAGAGGLSEGFIRTGYKPIAHVEMDSSACYTLKTRAAYNYLAQHGNIQPYIDYLSGYIKRNEFYSQIPIKILDTVINATISSKTIESIFLKIEQLLNGQTVDLIIGGPPCQAYSLIGRARDSNRMMDDKRNYLFIYYAQFLQRFKPKYFVFENVQGLLSAKNNKGQLIFKVMQNVFSAAGYTLEYQVLNAGDYGVPQNRKRVIIVGKQGNGSSFFPSLELVDTKVPISEILRDLPKIKNGEGSFGPCKVSKYYHPYLDALNIRSSDVPVTFHKTRSLQKRDCEIYHRAIDCWNKEHTRLNYNQLPQILMTHKNKNSFIDRFKVVAGDLYRCHTVVAHASHDGHFYIHPDITQNRSLSPRELARIQTFPDNYYFESASGEPTFSAAYKQIGNAVPVVFAQRLAEKLKEGWNND